MNGSALRLARQMIGHENRQLVASPYPHFLIVEGEPSPAVYRWRGAGQTKDFPISGHVSFLAPGGCDDSHLPRL